MQSMRILSSTFTGLRSRRWLEGMLRDRKEELGISAVALEAGHDLSEIGRYITRVQAVAEMVGLER